MLADTLDEHGGDTLVGDVIGARRGRVFGAVSTVVSGVQSAVISATAARAEDSSMMAFFK